MHSRGMRPRAALVTLTTGVLGLGTLAAQPVQAATLGEHDITGIQFVAEDCSRNEYVVDATVSGVTDDGGGFDKVRFEVWDDGELKDSRDREVRVGTTRELTAFLSFVGLYGHGAPGVGIQIHDLDADGSRVGMLTSVDPFYPDDVDGPCSFDVERVGGSTRTETAALLSEQKFVTADTVLIATAARFPDALAAAPWAAQLGAPLLLSGPDGLTDATIAELERLTPSSVLVIGGAGALGQGVLDDVQATLPTALVERIGGANRYATAATIAEHVVQDSSAEVYVASGQDFPDALVLSALAARRQAPLVLVRETSVPAETAAALDVLDYDTLLAAGGQGVISDEVLDAAAGGVPVTRYSGDDRYATAAAVLAEFPAEGRVMVATGAAFPDSLTAVPVAARTGAGVALSRPDTVPTDVFAEVDRLISGTPFPLVTIVGGAAAVNPSVETQLQSLFSTASEPADRPAGSSATENIPTS